MLSNGAFKLTDYQPAATAFTLEKNPDYYDAGKIALDGLAYQVIKDSQQALMSYQTSALDMTLLNGEQVDQVKDDPEGRWAALYEAEQISFWSRRSSSPCTVSAMPRWSPLPLPV